MSFAFPHAVHFVLAHLLLTLASVVIHRAGGIHRPIVAVVNVRDRTPANDPECIAAPTVRGFVFDLSNGGKSVASSADGASSAHAAGKDLYVLRLSASVVPRSQLSRFRMIWIHIHDSVVSDGQVLPVKLADARALARQDWVLVFEEHRLELLTETVGVFAPQRQLHFRAGIVAKLDRTLRFFATRSKHLHRNRTYFVNDTHDIDGGILHQRLDFFDVAEVVLHLWDFHRTLGVLRQRLDDCVVVQLHLVRTDRISRVSRRR